METQLKKLSRISKIECLNPFLYYSITINEGGIQLQGKFHGELVLQLTELFGKGKIDGGTGYVNFYRSNIKITLTQ